MPAPNARRIVLTAEERDILEAYVRRRKTARGLAVRSEIVLLAADGLMNKDIARRLRVTRSTLYCWRNRFSVQRLDELHDEPRAGAPATRMSSASS